MVASKRSSTTDVGLDVNSADARQPSKSDHAPPGRPPATRPDRPNGAYGKQSEPFADLIAADLTEMLLHPVWVHVISVTVAFVTVVILAAEVALKYALMWAALGIAAYGIRGIVVWFFLRTERPESPAARLERSRRWMRLYYPGAILLGIFWGGAPLLITISPTSANDGSAALILFIVAWMMAGGVMTHSARIEAVDAFIWPAAVLVSIAGLSLQEWPYKAIAALSLAYAAMLRLLSLRLNRASVAALRGQYEKATLADRLATAAAEVRQASRAKSEFLANMSHELRTPLNAIIGFSEIMAREILGPIGQARYRDYASDIQVSGKHLLGVINDILDLSRIEAGKMTLVDDEVNLADVIGGCVHLLSHRVLAAGLSVERQFNPETPLIRADEGRIRQIGFNLIANAIKFTPRGGSVWVSIGTNDAGEIVLSVADTGIGMRPEDIPIALTPFQQVQTGGARNHGGTGLGLPLTKTLVELHDGRLEISSALGQGTTVSVTFPRGRAVCGRINPGI